MATSVIPAYNPYLNNARYAEIDNNNNLVNYSQESKTNRVDSKNEIKKNVDINTTPKYNSIDVEHLISSEEKEFFKKLFPDSAELIDEHVLFTRNGNALNHVVNKGVLLDNRI